MCCLLLKCQGQSICTWGLEGIPSPRSAPPLVSSVNAFLPSFHAVRARRSVPIALVLLLAAPVTGLQVFCQQTAGPGAGSFPITCATFAAFPIEGISKILLASITICQVRKLL